MSSVFQKLIPTFLRSPKDDGLYEFPDDEPLDLLDDSSPPLPDPDIPEQQSDDAIILPYDPPLKRSIDRPVNPRKLPDGFLEVLSDVLLAEDDPYTKLILYSHVVCGTRIDILRERFVVTNTRGKQYIASREFVRHRLNKSLDRLRERYYEINGSMCYISTIDDSEEPYKADFSSGKTYSYHDTVEKTSSQPSTKGVVSGHEVEEEREYQKEEFQGPSRHQEKRPKLPRKKLLFVLDEEDYEEETDFNGVNFPSTQEPNM